MWIIIKVCLHTNLSRIGSDIIEILKYHPELKNINVVLAESVYNRLKNKELVFKEIKIDIISYCNFYHYDDVYVANDFKLVTAGIQNPKVTIIGDNVIKRITKILSKSYSRILSGEAPIETEEVLSSIVNEQKDIIKELVGVTDSVTAVKIINSPYLYLTEDYHRSRDKISIDLIGEEKVFVKSTESNSKKYYLRYPNSSEFLTKVKSYKAGYTIYRALKVNEENLEKVLLAIDCVKLSKSVEWKN